MSRILTCSILLAFFIPLAAYGANQNQELLQAAQRGDLATVEDLLKKGADKDSATDDGTTALMLAAAGGHTDIVQVLTSAGADVNTANSSGRTALMAASARGDTASLLILLDAGADVNAKSTDGGNALQAAEASGNPTVTVMLLGAGAEPTGEAASTPLPLAEPGVRVMRGAPHHRIIVHERPPLVDAAARGDAEEVRSLLASGADVNESESILGLTAMDMAKLEGHAEIVAMLKEAGAKEKQQ
jgi:ankyrin repeat protein